MRKMLHGKSRSYVSSVRKLVSNSTGIWAATCEHRGNNLGINKMFGIPNNLIIYIIIIYVCYFVLSHLIYYIHISN